MNSLPNIKEIEKQITDIKTFNELTLNNITNVLAEPWGIFCTRLSMLSSQKASNIVQTKFIKEFGLDVVPSKIDRGDAKKNDTYFEYKYSYVKTDKDKLDILQIRLYQNIQYYVVSLFDIITFPATHVLFLLTHDEMLNECNLLGGTTHGTKAATKNNQNKEYSIHLHSSDNNFKRWIDTYSILEGNLKTKINNIK